MRLSRRLGLVFSTFGLAIAGGFLYVHVKVLREEVYARAGNMAEVTSSAVRSLVEAQARAGRFAELGRDLETMVRRSGVASVTVLDRRGRRLLARADRTELLSREPHPDVAIERVEDGVFDFEVPVRLGTKGRGTVQIGFHTAAIEDRLREVESGAVQSAVTAFLAITLAALMIGGWFGLRIERLVPRIEALPRDPERFRPLRTDTSGDEVSRLAAAFNRLGESLRAETLRRRGVELEKRELAAMLVHDLKTPLTVIKSGLTLLEEQLREKTAVKAAAAAAPSLPGVALDKPRRKDDSHKRTFELLEMSSDRLLRMVEDVLQLSRLEEVSGLREREALDVGAMARACAKDFQLVVEDRKQSIAVDVPAAPFPVAGDAPLLRRVLDNLVHNAVEHTPEGGTITLSVRSDGETVRVSVSDSGPGVPPEARAHLFRKFFQKDLKRHVGNVGLGLALCEKAVHRHGGTIGIEDAEPRGARFYFVLPAAQPEML